jgi:hypothetical protein
MTLLRGGIILHKLSILIVAFILVAGLVFSIHWQTQQVGISSLLAADAEAQPLNIQIGINQNLMGRRIFPADDEWNRDISKVPVDPDSDVLIASIGKDDALHPDFGSSYQGAPYGIPYVIVSGEQKKVPVKFAEVEESDPGPYPIPPDAPIEGGANSSGDRHVVIIDKDNWILYEMYNGIPEDNGRRWRADSGAIFDLSLRSMQRRPGWTSADAAGLPIFAGLARYDEIVERGELTHALRFTVRHSRHAFIEPATHFASSNTSENLPPMGMRVRLKADFDISNFPPAAKVILSGLKRYGMIVADNGGNWYVGGTADSRWNDDDIQTLKRVHGGDFEVIRMKTIYTHVDD